MKIPPKITKKKKNTKNKRMNIRITQILIPGGQKEVGASILIKIFTNPN